jgi:hypothetical protein
MPASEVRSSLRRTAVELAIVTTLVGALAMTASTWHYGSHLTNVLLAWLGASIVTAGLVTVPLANDNEGAADHPTRSGLVD